MYRQSACLATCLLLVDPPSHIPLESLTSSLDLIFTFTVVPYLAVLFFPNTTRFVMTTFSSNPDIGKNNEDGYTHSAITTEEWDRYRPEIEALYASNKLEDVIDIMKSRFGFDANKGQYKRRFSKWETEKNFKGHDMKLYISNLSDDKTIRGRAVPASKVDRFKRRWEPKQGVDSHSADGLKPIVSSAHATSFLDGNQLESQPANPEVFDSIDDVEVLHETSSRQRLHNALLMTLVRCMVIIGQYLAYSS